MRHRWLTVLSLLCAAPLGADPTTPPASLWRDMVVKHRWDTVPAKWESLGHPPAGTTIDLHFALEPHRENALIDALYEVSDPRLPKYGAHLSREQVAELVAPHPDTLGLVYSWLEHAGVSSPISMTHGGDWLTVTGVPVSQANDLLDASYQLYRHTGANKTVLRTVGYALPVTLHAHVQTVAPTTYFSHPRTLQQRPRKRSRKAVVNTTATSGEAVSGRDDSEEVTLESVRWMYNTQAYVPAVPASTGQNMLGVAGFDGETPSQKDLTAFMDIYRTDARDATFTVEKVNDGEYDPDDPGKEASLNIQYAEGMAYPTPHIFYSIGGDVRWDNSYEPAPGDSYLEWLNRLLSQPNIPHTISVSYGMDEQELPEQYATAVCNLFGKLGLRGVSVLYASGDFGVGIGELEDWDCKDRSGQVNFVSIFPACCPWVTSVGGTMGHDPERAASLSGGGFSYHFPRPSYQVGAVNAYLKHLDTKYKGYFNADGRGYPDVSAQAVGFKVVVGGEISSLTDGTSFATPIVAGIISLLNDYLRATGHASLGFLNPWLYGKGFPGLNDIITGSNPGCRTDGFPAIIGWDPVTGIGTPDFLKLQKLVPLIPIVTASHSSTHSTPTCTTPASC